MSASSSSASSFPTSSSSMRLARFLASAGLGSRRHCEDLIREGRVSVNGEAVLTPVCVVTPGEDTISFEGRVLNLESLVYIMLNKPVGYTCSAQDEHARHLIYELLPTHLGRLFSIGRLDRDSEGLLLLTNDGKLTQILTHPSHQVSKYYIVECEGYFKSEMADNMVRGVKDEGETLRASQVTLKQQRPESMFLEIVLTEGKNREVRRLCASQGLKVLRLARTKFASLSLGTLPTGSWRRLEQDEIEQLRQAAKADG